MRSKALAFAVSCLLIFASVVFAHRIDEYLQATIFSLEERRMEASMRLIPGILVSPAVIAEIDRNKDGSFSDAEERAYAQRVLDDLTITLDGQSLTPKLISWNFPPPMQLRDGLGEIHIEYGMSLPLEGHDHNFIVANHHLSGKSVYLMNVLAPRHADIRVLAQERNQRQSLYELDYRPMRRADTAPFGLWGKARTWLGGIQFASLFQLGMRHIAQGTDHLLFLLVLLLPAPLLAAGRRWGPPLRARQSLLRILAIVTAFTMGHSITLTVAALNLVKISSRPVEVLIALSIFVSALHALRPLFPGKEALIAGFFGLVHGLAFAATLDRLGLGRWERVSGILAFNIGIEAMQILVVAAILPSLVLMSGTRAYSPFRIGGAVFAGVASAGWMLERAFGLNAHVDLAVNMLARHAVWIAATLLLISVACRLLLTKQTQSFHPACYPVSSREAAQPRPHYSRLTGKWLQ